MLTMPDTRGKFFSVPREVTIQGAKFRPAICYPLTSALRSVVEGMAEKGAAKIYAEKVRFISGAAYPVKKAEAPAVSAAAGEKAPAGKRLSVSSGKAGKKAGRDFN